MKLLVFHRPDFIDTFEGRMAYLRIPEVLDEVHWAEERFNRELIHLIQSEDAVFRHRLYLRFLIAFLIQKGLYRRAQKRFGNRSVYMVGPLGPTSLLAMLAGRQSLETIVQILISGVNAEDSVSNFEGATVTQDLNGIQDRDGDWGVYEKTGPRIFLHPIAETDRLKLLTTLVQTRQITEVVWLGFLEKKLENLLRQKLGAHLTLFDSLSSDPKLNVLRDSMLASFEWS